MKKKRLLKIVALITSAVIIVGTAIVFDKLSVPNEINAEVSPQNTASQKQPSPVQTIEDIEVIGEKTKDAVMLYLNSPIAFVKNHQTFVDEENPNATPLVENGRTFVPLRFIAEGFGADVSWDNDSKTATIKLDKKTVTCKLGESVLYIDGEEKAMDAPAKMQDGRVFIGLRSFAEAIGKYVFYDNGLIVISQTENIFDPKTDVAVLNGIKSKLNNLPLIGTKEKFIELAGEARSYVKRFEDDMVVMDEAIDTGGMKQFSPEPPAMDAAAPTMQESAANSEKEMVTADYAGETSGDFSKTNVQVQGVDEADVIKTDGEYIYLLRNHTLYVVKAVPAGDMRVDYAIEFDYESFGPREIYQDGDYLVVIGDKMGGDEVHIFEGVANDIAIKKGVSVQYGKPMVTAITYDISDKQNVKKLREVETEGYYNSSRKIGSTVYIVSNLWAYSIMRDNDYTLPVYRDTAVDQKEMTIGYDCMYYFPGNVHNSFTIITGFNIDDNEPAKISSYFGSGESIYASSDYLYIAAQGYNVKAFEPQPENDIGFKKSLPTRMPYYDPMTTVVYKFRLEDGDVSYLYKGEVPGNILNQFSMDDSNGYFKIATTSYDENYNSRNNLYVLDERMSIAGKIENIAPGEKIYSTRFMGKRAYMVTFKTVDPLFVIDLSNPREPKILGELKIPGYSDYLHPYDDTHLIGFGKDAIEKDGMAYYLGMKISIFDVSDVSNPVEMFTETIGDRGTDSELLRNHKALLFSRDKNLLAFPVTVCRVAPNAKSNPIAYGDFYFQGAYVYNIDLEKGFSLKGLITHEEGNAASKNNDYYYGDYEKFIDRIIYIGDSLYTTSNKMIKATSISEMKETGSLELVAK